MARLNVDAKEFIPTLKVTEKGLTLRLPLCPKDNYVWSPVKLGTEQPQPNIEVIEEENALTTFRKCHREKEEEITLWKHVCQPIGRSKLGKYFYEREPKEMAVIREYVMKNKIKLHKTELSNGDYCIYSGQALSKKPHIVAFSMRYHKDQPIPYMINFMSSDGINRIYQYDIKACRIISECQIMKCPDGRKIRYVTNYNYAEKKKCVKVIDCDTEVVIQKEEIPFKY